MKLLVPLAASLLAPRARGADPGLGFLQPLASAGAGFFGPLSPELFGDAAKTLKDCFFDYKKCLGTGPGSKPSPAVFHRSREAPRLDPGDARFGQWRPPGPGDSRCSCPALNSLANHGFLPRSGRGVTMLDIMVACFRGFGVSPETSALITADGLGEAKLPLNTTLALADVQRADFGIVNLFQHEFIPAACTPSRVRALFDTVVGYATQSILENPELQKTSEGRVSTREQILVITGGREIPMNDVKKAMRVAGFRQAYAFATINRLEENAALPKGADGDDT